MANMGAEVGATTSTFPYTPGMRSYLNATGRAPVAQAADQAASQGFLSADPGAEYDELIEVVSTFPMSSEVFELISAPRTFLNWSPLSTDLSPQTWPHPFRSSARLYKNKDGKTSSRLV